jgi:hypothetical protein
MASGRFPVPTCSWPGAMHEIAGSTPEKVLSMGPVYSVTDVAGCYRVPGDFVRKYTLRYLY